MPQLKVQVFGLDGEAFHRLKSATVRESAFLAFNLSAMILPGMLMLSTSIRTVAFTLGVSLGIHAAEAQEADALVEIPLDLSAPEVVDLRQAEQAFNFRALSAGLTAPLTLDPASDATIAQAAQQLQRSPHTVLLSLVRMAEPSESSDQFFAAIDLPGLAQRAASGDAGSALRGLASQVAAIERNFLAIDANTTFSPPDQAWFATQYPEIETNLHCNWKYDPKLAEAVESEDEKQREQELEEAFRRENTERDSPADGASSPEEAAPSEIVDEEEGEDGIERQFLIAGRPCLLSYMCGWDELPCSEEIADELVESVVLITTGSE
ncbi:MAG TPA: hypothetical protein VGN97_03290 [Mesorhizobium sp.]|nr:hypothetical protein [Mesorhizobium sp.]